MFVFEKLPRPGSTDVWTCPSCRSQWAPDYIREWRQRARSVPAQLCPDRHCGELYLRKLHRRVVRQPTLSEHVIDTMRSAGCGNVSLAAQHLIEAYTENPVPLVLDWRQLNKPLAHLPYAQTIRRSTAIRMDNSVYEKLMKILDLNIKTQPLEQRIYGGRGKGKPRDMMSPLTALANLYNTDVTYREAVRMRIPAGERALYENPVIHPLKPQEDWLS